MNALPFNFYNLFNDLAVKSPWTLPVGTKFSSDREAFVSALNVCKQLPGICLNLNKNREILAISDFGAHYLGYETSELVGKSIDVIVAAADLDTYHQKLDLLERKQTAVQNWVGQQVCKDGKPILVKISGSLITYSEALKTLFLIC
ncbi:MAG: PAS domain S-box protein, partial [Desertifilum sp. SIO1I2]|nr:PAS domain S-box protein [Desertifilum sp. SIO1I2]